VYDGPGRRSWTDHAEPQLSMPTDAIVRIDAVTICGTDLHILKGDVPEVERGRILGHEAVGTIVEAGSAVTTVKPGDTVVIVGAGPIGLAAITNAQLFSPSTIIVVDKEPARLDAAKSFGADLMVSPDDAAAVVAEASGGLGADVAIEAVGIPETFELCTKLVRPGGHVANVGVHGAPATLHLEELWIKNVTITTGLVDTSSTPMLLRMLAAGRLDTSRSITHRFGLDEMDEAYDVFAHPQDSTALKVALFRG
jgi:alcohol dehydrogenase